MSGKRSIFIGYDPREATAFAVARDTCRRHLNLPTPIYGLLLPDLKRRGIYRRPIEMRASAADRPIMWDTVSDAPMSTEHANARFFVPHLAKTGNSRLRRALYLPAIVAMRHNPVVRALAERLRARGKRPMVIVGAAMRKLLHLLYGVLKSAKPFDPALALAA